MQLNQQHIHIPQPQTQFQSEIIVAAALYYKGLLFTLFIEDQHPFSQRRLLSKAK